MKRNICYQFCFEIVIHRLIILFIISIGYYTELDIHVRDKVKVVLDLPNFATKTELEPTTGIDRFDLAAQIDFVHLKADVYKLDINKLTNVSSSLNNFNTRVNDQDVVKLKTAVGFKTLCNVVDNRVARNTKFKTLKTKVSNLENKILDTTILIRINRYNRYKQNLEKRLGDVDKKIPDTSGLVIKTVFKYKNW